jgi:hypothetical protein
MRHCLGFIKDVGLGQPHPLQRDEHGRQAAARHVVTRHFVVALV